MEFNLNHFFASFCFICEFNEEETLFINRSFVAGFHINKFAAYSSMNFKNDQRRAEAMETESNLDLIH